MRITINDDDALILLDGLRHLSIVSIPPGRDPKKYGESLKKLRKKLEPTEAEKSTEDKGG